MIYYMTDQLLSLLFSKGRKPKRTRCRFLSKLYSLEAFRPTPPVIVRQVARETHAKKTAPRGNTAHFETVKQRQRKLRLPIKRKEK